MKTGLKDIDQLLELNEQLNQELLEAHRELRIIELDHLVTNIELGRTDKARIMELLDSHD